ncbi:MAG: GNAT family N-acetyltransferase, partial [Clostridia bacterium]|nr:GNAT family N-acetyltransferase [Clostridia bacterium]
MELENVMTNNLNKRIQQAKCDGKFIQTARLLLLPLDVSDAPEAFKWLSDPEVTKFMNYTIYTDVADVAKWIAESGHNCFGFFLRENGQLIGSGDVRDGRNHFDEGVYEL